MMPTSLLDRMIEQKHLPPTQQNEQLMQEIGAGNAAGAMIRNPSLPGSSYPSPSEGNANIALTLAAPDQKDLLRPYHDTVTNVHPAELAPTPQSTKLIGEERAAPQTSGKPTRRNKNASKFGLPPKPRKYAKKGTQQQTIEGSEQCLLEDDHGTPRGLSGASTVRGETKSMTLKTTKASTRRKKTKKKVEKLLIRSKPSSDSSDPAVRAVLDLSRINPIFEKLLSESLDRRKDTIPQFMLYGVYPGAPLLVEVHYSNREKWLLGFNQVVNLEGKPQSESILKEHFAKLSVAFVSVVGTTIRRSPQERCNLVSCLCDAIFGTSKYERSVRHLKNIFDHPVIGTFERPELISTFPLAKPQRILLAFFSGELSGNPQEVAILLVGYFLQKECPEIWASKYSNNFETYLEHMSIPYPDVQLQLMQKWYKSPLSDISLLHPFISPPT